VPKFFLCSKCNTEVCRCSNYIAHTGYQDNKLIGKDINEKVKCGRHSSGPIMMSIKVGSWLVGKTKAKDSQRGTIARKSRQSAWNCGIVSTSLAPTLRVHPYPLLEDPLLLTLQISIYVAGHPLLSALCCAFFFSSSLTYLNLAKQKKRVERSSSSFYFLQPITITIAPPLPSPSPSRILRCPMCHVRSLRCWKVELSVRFLPSWYQRPTFGSGG